jgi:hypothetical protein
MAREPRTMRELIYWEYAKLIAGSAAGSRTNYRFVSHTYQKLMKRQIEPSSILTENQHLFSSGEICAYCGATHQLQWEHIVPRAIGGPDTFDNLVRACAPCNLSKGVRDPYQWYEAKDIDGIPRLVLGKFLKLVFSEYALLGVLDSPDFMRTQNIKRVTLSAVFTRR